MGIKKGREREGEKGKGGEEKKGEKRKGGCDPWLSRVVAYDWLGLNAVTGTFRNPQIHPCSAVPGQLLYKCRAV